MRTRAEYRGTRSEDRKPCHLCGALERLELKNTYPAPCSLSTTEPTVQVTFISSSEILRSNPDKKVDPLFHLKLHCNFAAKDTLWGRTLESLILEGWSELCPC